MRKLTSLGAAVAVLLLTVAWHSGIAQAQYPTPSGNLTVATSQTTALVGGSVTVSATLRDVDGNRLASHSCILHIANQPGSDASVTPANANTDAAGVVTATVYVGRTPGTVAVRVTCGAVTGGVDVVAGVAVGPGAPPPSAIELPSTGSGAGPRSGGTNVTVVLGMAVVLLALGIQAVRARRPRG